MLCGVDEAGRGPIIGPLVICGIAIENDDLLRSLGVRDSKKLSKSQREMLSGKIERVINDVEIIEISAEEIDAIRTEMTLNQLEVKVFASVIDKLNPITAYVDSADIDAQRFADDILQEMNQSVNIVSSHRADEIYPVVSAASILAKIRRDVAIMNIEQEIGEPIGSGYPSDPATVKFLQSWIERYDTLPPYSRKSWDTSARLLRMKSLRSIDEF